MTESTVPAQVLAATAAAAAVLPLPQAPTVGEPIPAGQDPADLFAVLPPGASSLIVAEWEQAGEPGAFGVVVGSALTQALADSPLGALDLAAAVQPALDAAAAAVGAVAGPGQSVDLNAAVGEVFPHPQAFLVPLTDADGWVCATVFVLVPAETGAFVADVPTPPAPAPPAPSAPSTPAAAIAQPAIPRQSAAPARTVAPAGGLTAGAGLALLRDVVMEVTVELGRTRMTISELLSLSPGAVVELDRAAGSPADLLVNGTLLARGEVVVVDEDFGIRITEIVAAVGADTAGASA